MKPNFVAGPALMALLVAPCAVEAQETPIVSTKAAEQRALAARLRAAADESASTRSRLVELEPGMEVRDARGVRVGVVTRIVRSRGVIRSVQVRGADRRAAVLAPQTLTVSGRFVIAAAPPAR